MTESSAPLPAVFVSHGSPMHALEAGATATGQAWTALGRRLPRPRAILIASAHWETERPALTGSERPETIHDFYGFPPPLYEIHYPAPGAPQIAERARALLSAAGMQAAVDPARGLDHGAWNPLLLIFPQADLPVAQLSVQSRQGPAAHLALGRALAPLRAEGVLVMGSGSAVHNLRQFQVDRTEPAPWAVAFDDWLAERIAAGDDDALVNYRAVRAEGSLAHPTDEHFLPLFVALGAGGAGPGRALHRSFAHGSLSMAAYAWGDLRG